MRQSIISCTYSYTAITTLLSAPRRRTAPSELLAHFGTHFGTAMHNNIVCVMLAILRQVMPKHMDISNVKISDGSNSTLNFVVGNTVESSITY